VNTRVTRILLLTATMFVCVACDQSVPVSFNSIGGPNQVVKGTRVKVKEDSSFTGLVVVLPTCNSCSIRGVDFSKLDRDQDGAVAVFAPNEAVGVYQKRLKSVRIDPISALSLNSGHLPDGLSWFKVVEGKISELEPGWRPAFVQ
jgi:hypothetical protein